MRLVCRILASDRTTEKCTMISTSFNLYQSTIRPLLRFMIKYMCTYAGRFLWFFHGDCNINSPFHKFKQSKHGHLYTKQLWDLVLFRGTPPPSNLPELKKNAIIFCNSHRRLKLQTIPFYRRKRAFRALEFQKMQWLF